MHAQNTPSPIQQDDQIDTAVMGLLLDSPRPLSLEEIKRETGSPLAAEDSVARLVGVGLAHRFDNFVFATRAAMRAIGIGN
jgi:hypothetical protein